MPGGPRPSSGHTLDRINNDGYYEPSNIRWATSTEQRRNRRDTQRFELNGQQKTLAEWSELAGIPYSRVRQRVLTYGWPLDEALGTPITGTGRISPSDRRRYEPQPA